MKAYNGEEDFLVKIDETRRVLKLMDAIRESGRTGKSPSIPAAIKKYPKEVPYLRNRGYGTSSIF